MTHAYRADQVGSLLRPDGLMKARRQRAEGRLSVEELRALEDEAILEALEHGRVERGAELVASHIMNLKKGALSAVPGSA